MAVLGLGWDRGWTKVAAGRTGKARDMWTPIILAGLALAVGQTAEPPASQGQGESARRDLPRQCRAARGSVRVTCVVQADGAMDQCTTSRERPRGCGFAEAALDAARKARVRLEPGRITAGERVNYTMHFRLED